MSRSQSVKYHKSGFCFHPDDAKCPACVLDLTGERRMLRSDTKLFRCRHEIWKLTHFVIKMYERLYDIGIVSNTRDHLNILLDKKHLLVHFDEITNEFNSVHDFDYLKKSSLAVMKLLLTCDRFSDPCHDIIKSDPEFFSWVRKEMRG